MLRILSALTIVLSLAGSSSACDYGAPQALTYGYSAPPPAVYYQPAPAYYAPTVPLQIGFAPPPQAYYQPAPVAFYGQLALPQRAFLVRRGAFVGLRFGY